VQTPKPTILAIAIAALAHATTVGKQAVAVSGRYNALTATRKNQLLAFLRSP
jgi:hypothetical protein